MRHDPPFCLCQGQECYTNLVDLFFTTDYTTLDLNQYCDTTLTFCDSE